MAGGIAFAPDGDLLVGVCRGDGVLNRFGGSPVERDGSTVRQDTVIQTSIGCGLADGPDGVYSNTSQGVVKVDPDTGAILAGPAGPAGNGLGIAYDAQSARFIYAAPTGLAWVGADLATGGVLTTLDQYDGVSLDPTGATIFAADGEGLDVLNRAGIRVQRVPHTAGPGGETDGVAFHAGDGYVVTNNHDGTVTRLDFPGGDYSRTPQQTLLGAGGFRGDLVQVGADTCLYLTQDGTRYADGTVTAEQSIVRVCGGFVPPALTPPDGSCPTGSSPHGEPADTARPPAPRGHRVRS